VNNSNGVVGVGNPKDENQGINKDVHNQRKTITKGTSNYIPQVEKPLNMRSPLQRLENTFSSCRSCIPWKIHGIMAHRKIFDLMDQSKLKTQGSSILFDGSKKTKNPRAKWI
jgi:hypothetical protein